MFCYVLLCEFANFEVWVKDFKFFDLRFEFRIENCVDVTPGTNLIVVDIFLDFFEFFKIVFLVFDSFFEIGGSNLSKKVRETISITEQCLPSLFLSVAPSYVEKTIFKKCDSHDY